ncbi:MAG: hypothetical protein AMJ78_00040 [Omnitrophica WOR_2 bacterium SM23_29]|nr:MAG: hypothetical protein AMJ78_00040 [Omnitrophica WOR_2 bacterium SM23_29]
MLEIGRKAKQLRLNKALSLDALARKSSLSKSFLSEFERGKKFPRLDTLQRLAKALEVDIHFFFNK